MNEQVLLGAVTALAGVVALLWRLDRGRLLESLQVAQSIIEKREQRIDELYQRLLHPEKTHAPLPPPPKK